MAQSVERSYRFLDGEAERRALVEDIRAVRQDVVQASELVPKDQQYEPRYHGWSLAAMLGHLQLMDTLQTWTLNLALLGIQVPVSPEMLDGLNDTMAGIYRRRLVETTIRGIQRNEGRIADLIMRLPVDKFSKQVYLPAQRVSLTVEQAVQEFFLYHWRDHLETMRRTDDIHYEPPSGSMLI